MKNVDKLEKLIEDYQEIIGIIPDKVWNELSQDDRKHLLETSDILQYIFEECEV